MPGARLEVRLRLKRFGAPPGRAPALRPAASPSPRRNGDLPVLGPVAFDAGPGEVLAVFGPSGTGKSTLLRIVLGLDPAFEGSVARPPGPAGVVFQEPRLAPWLDVAANLRLVAPDLDAAATAALLAPLGLAGTERMRPSALSLGMQRRVALARALAIRPQWLVLDEPFASLDPGLATTLGAIVARHARDTGAIVLLATHELDQALALATRILVLSGRPATLAADIAVPSADRASLRADLLSRFAFLGGA
ncbi:MAG: ATP-binding cassette domain-containing protein [Janthinobacterium lividum]